MSLVAASATANITSILLVACAAPSLYIAATCIQDEPEESLRDIRAGFASGLRGQRAELWKALR